MTRIFVENYELDLTAEISQQLTFSVDDIKNLDSKTTAFSKTIVISGTENNNKIFGNIFELSNANFGDTATKNVFYDFDASRSAQARIEINGLQAMKGIIRLLSITIDKGMIDYEVALFGELGGFISKVGNKRLTDLDFSNYDHNWNEVNISSSWAEEGIYNISTSYQFQNPITPVSEKYDVVFPLRCNDINLSSIQPFDKIKISGTANNDGIYTALEILWQPNAVRTILHLAEPTTPETGSTCTIEVLNPLGYGYIYPLIDYGNGYPTGGGFTKYHDWQYKTFRPALFVLEYIDKIITGAGYTWESDFLKTDFFRRLIIPNNDIALEKRGENFYLNADLEDVSYDFLTSGSEILEFDNINTNNGFNITGSNSIFTFTTNDIKNVKIKVNIDAVFRKPPLSRVFILLYKNQEIISRYEPEEPFKELYDNVKINLEATTSIKNNDVLKIVYVYQQGYKYEYQNVGTYINPKFEWVKVFQEIHTFLDINYALFTIQQEPEGFVQYSYDDLIKINDTIPKNIYQKDFFISIMKMFNLMVFEKRDKEKHLIIEPYIEFYNTDSTTYLDWSYKVNRDKPIVIKPMSEINARYYEFKLKEDSDYFNELYKKKFNTTYGNRIFDNQLEFAKENQSVEIIFSPSILFGETGEDKIFSAIYKFDDSNGEQPTAHNIRIMLYKYVKDVEEWNLLDTDGTSLNNYLNYPYAGHLNNPDFPTIDINWGAPKQLFFNLQSGSLQYNQFNNFYSPYMAEIIDKDSRLVTCEMKLNEIDIFNLDFRRFVMIDGVLFRLQKITDWSEGALCKVDLLRVINTTYEADSPYSSKLLRIRFTDKSYADSLIGGDASEVSRWNSFFGLPATNRFSSVYVENNDFLFIGNCKFSVENIFDGAVNMVGIWDNNGNFNHIGDNAFNACQQLETFYSVGNIDMVEGSAFYGCTALKEFSAKNCLSIGDEAFRGCFELQIIDLSSLESITDPAFPSTTGNNIQLTINNKALQLTGVQSLISNNNVTLIII
jgi:hypothetical protein